MQDLMLLAKAWFTLNVKIGDGIFWTMWLKSIELCITVGSILWFVRHSFTYVTSKKNIPYDQRESGSSTYLYTSTTLMQYVYWREEIATRKYS